MSGKVLTFLECSTGTSFTDLGIEGGLNFVFFSTELRESYLRRDLTISAFRDCHFQSQLVSINKGMLIHALGSV